MKYKHMVILQSQRDPRSRRYFIVTREVNKMIQHSISHDNSAKRVCELHYGPYTGHSLVCQWSSHHHHCIPHHQPHRHHHFSSGKFFHYEYHSFLEEYQEVIENQCSFCNGKRHLMWGFIHILRQQVTQVWELMTCFWLYTNCWYLDTFYRYNLSGNNHLDNK